MRQIAKFNSSGRHLPALAFLYNRRVYSIHAPYPNGHVPRLLSLRTPRSDRDSA